MMRYEYNVTMTCDGCKRAVNALVSKVPGVEKLEIDLPNQLVVVEGTAKQEEIESAIKKTGKQFSRK